MVFPKGWDFRLGFSTLGLQCCFGIGWENVLVVASDHDEQAHQTEIEIFQDSIPIGIDLNCLKRIVLLSLHIGL